MNSQLTSQTSPDCPLKYISSWASLVAQWLRIRLPMQGTRVRALVWEDPTCSEQLSPWATATEAHAPRACEPQLLSPRATTTEAHTPRARAPQQEKPQK